MQSQCIVVLCSKFSTPQVSSIFTLWGKAINHRSFRWLVLLPWVTLAISLSAGKSWVSIVTLHLITYELAPIPIIIRKADFSEQKSHFYMFFNFFIWVYSCWGAAPPIPQKTEEQLQCNSSNPENNESQQLSSAFQTLNDLYTFFKF